MKKLFTLIALLSFLGVANASEQHYKVTWVLAHQPIDLFKVAADIFTKEVNAKTHGSLEIEVLTLPEYEGKYNQGRKLSHKEFLQEIQNGKIQMSQTYTTDLGSLSQSMYVLDLPFLFRNHDHAQKVLEGKIGTDLLTSLTSSKIRGLAFTYSGGYRILPGTKKISKVEDFKKLNIRTSPSPVAQDTFKAVGANPIPMSLDDIENGIKSGKINEAESTYARFFPNGQNKVAKIVNETNHSLFLTSIIVSENFWSSLPESYKKIMKDAAISAARGERAHSIVASDETREKCLKSGIEVVTLNKTEEGKFRNAVKSVYAKYSPIFGEKLISSIQNE